MTYLKSISILSMVVDQIFLLNFRSGFVDDKKYMFSLVIIYGM